MFLFCGGAGLLKQIQVMCSLLFLSLFAFGLLPSLEDTDCRNPRLRRRVSRVAWPCHHSRRGKKGPRPGRKGVALVVEFSSFFFGGEKGKSSRFRNLFSVFAAVVLMMF